MLRAARPPRLHADRHDLRLGAERLEERAALRRGRLHLDHSRQGLARGNAGDRVAGGRVRRHAISSSSTGQETEIVCDYIRRGGDRDAFLAALRQGRVARLRSRPRSAAHRPRQPDDDADVGVARDRRDAPRRDARPLRRRRRCRSTIQAFDTICSATQDRQDAVVALLREQAGRPDDRDRRLQQQQHRQPGPHLRQASRPTFHIADPDCLVSAQRDPASAGRRQDRGDRDAAGCPPTGRSSIGLTSGASTPDNLVGAAIARLAEFCG